VVPAAPYLGSTYLQTDDPQLDDRALTVTINLTRNGPRRWREQRWLIDVAIRTDGLEWDQPRIGYTLKPIGVDAVFDFRWVDQQIRKFADITPAFSAAAERRERKARAAEEAGRSAAAREHYFIAALLWASAEWPIWETSPHLLALDDRKNDCYEGYARHADHVVERVELPFSGGTLPGWLHFPPGWDGRPLAAVLACGGMDAPKELNVALYGDKLLQRGFAVLSVDGPGQGEAPIRGVHMTPTAWIDAGRVWMDYLMSRPEIDDDRLAAFGLSFGSFWMTQVAATQPRLKGCAVGLVCHEPGGHTIFEQASPTFKARYMWMADIDDEEEFDRFAAQLDLRELVADMQVPWLAVAGEEDELSPIEHTYDLAARCGAPSSLLVYEGERHAFSGAPSTVHGPNWNTYAYDWLRDRVDGVPAEDCFEWVDATGTVTRRPHPRQQTEDASS
jgi:alpha-beta hydrolase superfamily lysophospholipase